MTADGTADSPAPGRGPATGWILRGGAIAQAVVGMLLVTADRGGIRPEVARDILIVGVLNLCVAMLVAVLVPSAAGSRTVRRVMLVAVALATLVTMAGVLAQAVTPWTVVPAGVLVLGMVALYRDAKAAGDGGGPGRRAGR